MALVVEDGTGKSNANSYLSVADADTYQSNRSNATWAALSTADKEVALIKATDWIEASFKVRWLGYRINNSMSLSWPRYDVVDYDGYVIAATAVPAQIQDVTAIMGYEASQAALFTNVAADARNLTHLSQSAGPVSQTKSYQGSSMTAKRFTQAEKIVAQFLLSAGRVYRA